MSKPNLLTAAVFFATLAIALGDGTRTLQAQVFASNWQSNLAALDDRVSLLPPVNDDGSPFSLAQRDNSGNPSLRGLRAADNSDNTSASQSARSNDSGNSDRLIDDITNPIAPLMQFRFRENWNWPVDNSGPDNQQFQFRPTIPFKAWDQENLLRVTIPYNIEGSGAPGLDKVSMFDALIFQPEWGTWGVGPEFQFNPHSSSGKDECQIGPVFGAVTKSKHWSVGFICQNFLSHNNSETQIQPILAYKFNDKLALAIGDMQFKYDWNGKQWTQLPLGVELDYIADLWGQKMQFFANPQYNFETNSSSSGWTVFVGLTLLVPGA